MKPWSFGESRRRKSWKSATWFVSRTSQSRRNGIWAYLSILPASSSTQHSISSGKVNRVGLTSLSGCVELRRGVFTCVVWQVTLCNPIWQLTLRSSEVGLPWRAIPWIISTIYLVFTDAGGARGDTVDSEVVVAVAAVAVTAWVMIRPLFLARWMFGVTTQYLSDTVSNN